MRGESSQQTILLSPNSSLKETNPSHHQLFFLITFECSLLSLPTKFKEEENRENMNKADLFLLTHGYYYYYYYYCATTSRRGARSFLTSRASPVCKREECRSCSPSRPFSFSLPYYARSFFFLSLSPKNLWIFFYIERETFFSRVTK